MDETIDNRVARLEFRADAQDTKMESLERTQETFGRSLEAIERTLIQIKYALYGAGLVVAGNALGFKQVVAKLLVGL